MQVKTARDLGNVVHDRRKSLGLTQAELAARAGASRLWVNQVEAGHGGAALSKVLQLLSALGLSVDVEAQEPAHGSSVVPAGTSPSARSRGIRTAAADPARGKKMAMPKARPVGTKGR